MHVFGERFMISSLRSLPEQRSHFAAWWQMRSTESFSTPTLMRRCYGSWCLHVLALSNSNWFEPKINSHLHRVVLWFISADIDMDSSLVNLSESTGNHSSESRSVSHWDVSRCRQYWVWRACQLHSVVGQRDLPQLTGKMVHDVRCCVKLVALILHPSSAI